MPADVDELGEENPFRNSQISNKAGITMRPTHLKFRTRFHLHHPKVIDPSHLSGRKLCHNFPTQCEGKGRRFSIVQSARVTFPITNKMECAIKEHAGIHGSLSLSFVLLSFRHVNHPAQSESLVKFGCFNERQLLIRNIETFQLILIST